jgi:ferrous iron transport protein A
MFFGSSGRKAPASETIGNGGVRLSECRPGQGGTIHRLDLQGPLAQRLMELGFIEGSRVEVVRTAPLGDPIEVRLHYYELSLRKSEAHHVELRP